jgi:hypothetical protein
MTDSVARVAPRKKTPADATAFEREQLRFFLSEAALSQDAEVGVKWKVQRGCRASH